MEEHELLAPAQGLMDRKGTLELSDSEKIMLANWAESTEYKVFLRLAEAIIEVAETAHFKVWKDKEAFDRTGLMAVSMRVFFERLQNEVKVQYEEAEGELDFLRHTESSPEEIVQNSFR